MCRVTPSTQQPLKKFVPYKFYLEWVMHKTALELCKTLAQIVLHHTLHGTTIFLGIIIRRKLELNRSMG